MKAMQMVSREIGPVLQPVNAPQPVPGLGEVLIQVHAAGVITTELGWYPTTHTKSGASRTSRYPDTSSPASSPRSALECWSLRSATQSTA